MRTRYPFLDGLRGFAALFVVLHHVHSEATRLVDLPPRAELATRVFALGHYPVAVFIVLSGFSLMLPVAASSGLRLEGGLAAYLLRRARRILPAYYAALAGAVLLSAVLPAAFPPVEAGAVLSHVSLFHNLRPEWCYAIDPPMWSVATEAQIYLLFPTLLLPLFRRWGGAATVLVGTGIGLAVQWLAGAKLGWVCPWYLGLFAMGMCAAAARGGRRCGGAGVVALIAFVGGLSLVCHRPQWVVPADLLTGISAACFMAWAAAFGNGPRSVIVRSLESRPALFLGEISYGLYLVHYPIVAVASHLLRETRHLGPIAFTAALGATATGVSVLAAMGLRAGVERRFASPRTVESSPHRLERFSRQWVMSMAERVPALAGPLDTGRKRPG